MKKELTKKNSVVLNIVDKSKVQLLVFHYLIILKVFEIKYKMKFLKSYYYSSKIIKIILLLLLL